MRPENRWQLAALAGVVTIVIVALGIIIFALVNTYWEEQSRPGQAAIRIDKVTYDLGYFTARLRLFVQQSGGPGSSQASAFTAPSEVGNAIIEEHVAIRFAREKNVSIRHAEIEKRIRERLGLSGEPITIDIGGQAGATPSPSPTPDAGAFQKAYKEELDRTGLSSSEYRRMVLAQILIGKIRGKFLRTVPDKAESVHYRLILVQSEEDADKAIHRIRKGEGFGKVATEVSLDGSTRPSGGDAGWVPRDALDVTLADTLFAMKEKEIQKLPTQSGVFVLQLLETAKSRKVETSQKPAMADRAYRDWLDKKRRSLEIDNLVLNDNGKLEWALRQVYGS